MSRPWEGTTSPRTVRPISRDERARHAADAIRLFNAGAFWESHEALEVIWRSVDDPAEARVLQGLIQGAAALLHRDRGNRHGVEVVGGAALEKLVGPQHPAVEFETVLFRTTLAMALEDARMQPRLRMRAP